VSPVAQSSMVYNIQAGVIMTSTAPATAPTALPPRPPAPPIPVAAATAAPKAAPAAMQQRDPWRPGAPVPGPPPGPRAMEAVTIAPTPPTAPMNDNDRMLEQCMASGRHSRGFGPVPESLLQACTDDLDAWSSSMGSQKMRQTDNVWEKCRRTSGAETWWFGSTRKSYKSYTLVCQGCKRFVMRDATTSKGSTITRAVADEWDHAFATFLGLPLSGPSVREARNAPSEPAAPPRGAPVTPPPPPPVGWEGNYQNYPDRNANDENEQWSRWAQERHAPPGGWRETGPCNADLTRPGSTSLIRQPSLAYNPWEQPWNQHQ
jgi:hypothetical protein